MNVFFCDLYFVIEAYENLSKEELITELVSVNANWKEQETINQQLRAELDQLKRMLFGSKSERFIPAVSPLQGNLFELPEAEEKPAPTEEIKYERKKPAKKIEEHAGRKILPSHLERVEIFVEPKEDITGLKKIGEEITEELEYRQAVLFVNQYIRPKYAKQNAEGVLIAELPSRPIDKGIPGPGLLAHILISKYTDHLPLYRQIQQMERLGVSIPQSTMSEWFSQSCDLITPLYNVLKKEVLKSFYLQVDETPIKVLDKDKKGSAHKGFYWVYHSPEKKLVLFDYRQGRGREGPQEMLEGFAGYLQTDGYGVYDKFESDKIKLLNCMAHARRKFEEALKNDKDRAEHALFKIQCLYAIERFFREENISREEKQKLRKQDAEPILNEMHQWLKDEIIKVTPKSLIGQAIAYSLARWDKLSLYITDGRLEIDNNLVENSIRPVAVGRKNYLFAGSHDAAQRAAMIYSLLGTCKKNGIEPFEWLKNTLSVLPDYKANQLHLLLPIK